jgi:hypothetical protein
MDEIVINKMSAGEMLLLDQTPVERWCLGIVPTLNFFNGLQQSGIVETRTALSCIAPQNI